VNLRFAHHVVRPSAVGFCLSSTKRDCCGHWDNAVQALFEDRQRNVSLKSGTTSSKPSSSSSESMVASPSRTDRASFLDAVFHLAAGAVDLLAERLRRGVLGTQRGDDKAWDWPRRPSTPPYRQRGAGGCLAERMVRIQSPPARSLLRTSLSGRIPSENRRSESIPLEATAPEKAAWHPDEMTPMRRRECRFLGNFNSLNPNPSSQPATHVARLSKFRDPLRIGNLDRQTPQVSRIMSRTVAHRHCAPPGKLEPGRKLAVRRRPMRSRLSPRPHAVELLLDHRSLGGLALAVWMF